MITTSLKRAALALAVAVLLPSSAAATRTQNNPGVGVTPVIVGGSPTPEPPQLSVEATLSPRPAFFGDEVDAQITVELDTRDVRASSVSLNPDFSPYEETAAPLLRRTRAGSELIDEFSYTLQCVDDNCLPGKGPRLIELPPLDVTALTPTGARVEAHATWPATAAVSRLLPSEVASSTPSFRSAEALPTARYRIAPRTLVALLVIVAAVLAFAALSLVATEVVTWRRRQRAQSRSADALVRAIAAARASAARPDASDRRKAIDLLARTLAASGADELAQRAQAAAWAEQPPVPERTLGLADEAERLRSEPSLNEAQA